MRVEQQMRVSVLGPYGPGDVQKMGQDMTNALSSVPNGASVSGFDHSHFVTPLGGHYVTIIMSTQRYLPDEKEAADAKITS